MKQLYLSTLAALALCFVGCKQDEPIPVSDIALNKTALSLNVGETGQLTATVTPENAEDKTVTWTSDKPEVAAVSDEGLVTALGPGEATITAKAGQRTATCEVTVQDPSITAHFDPLFAQVLQNEGVIADAKRILPEEVKEITQLLLYL